MWWPSQHMLKMHSKHLIECIPAIDIGKMGVLKNLKRKQCCLMICFYYAQSPTTIICFVLAF